MEKQEFTPIEKAPEGWMGIAEATKVLEVKHAQYTRRLLLEGKLDAAEGEEGPNPERFQGKGYTKWLIPPEAIARYRARAATRSGLRRYTLRAEKEAEKAIRAALDASGVEYTLEFSYQPKKEEEEAEETAGKE